MKDNCRRENKIFVLKITMSDLVLGVEGPLERDWLDGLLPFASHCGLLPDLLLGHAHVLDIFHEEHS